jgi:hypothetical protein
VRRPHGDEAQRNENEPSGAACGSGLEFRDKDAYQLSDFIEMHICLLAKTQA